MKKRRHTRHGLSYHPLYVTWAMIVGRCCDPRRHDYPRYGGRGITIDAEWRERPDLFIRWVVAHLGDRPSPDHQLDRIKNDKGYEPGNLRWTTRSQNMRNARSNRLVRVGEITLPVVAWSEITGVSQRAIHHRLNVGWTPALAVTTPATRSNRGQPQMTEVPQSVQRWREQAKEALRSLAPLCRANQIPPKLRPLVYALNGVHRATTVEAVHRAAKSAQLGFPSAEEIKVLDSLSPAILDAFAVIGAIEFQSLASRLASKN